MKKLSMSRKIQMFAIVLLSGFFLTACKGHHGEHGGRMFDLASYKLDLTDAQEEKWFAIRDELKQVRKDARSEKKAHLEEAKALVMADTLDQALVLKRFEEHQQKMLAAAPSIVEKVAEFHATLTPEQKEKVVGLFDRWASKSKGHH